VRSGVDGVIERGELEESLVQVGLEFYGEARVVVGDGGRGGKGSLAG
jgi:hypothetical protein